ncbi:sigma-70 family RNA polymerase sigma factor [Aestuariivirga sp. YIM B02566]|uniref:Sigma-70 family RNA polymerase sigma factor n=1 Tax=Taklimakanibacter albus TaxID=2800327 RepID=A0ACC5QXS4_9HYPH|nr:sigma-70 family RNA polymerase sigma factor [Aestuariivirga sp. YIM B02566]MBK1865147.1 sigma-70 family RNA polymerase sigma factor [Aestuariivirga sp. YIM B02566]
MDRFRGRFDVIGQLTSLRRYARSLTRDPADVEDLVHDALLRAFERKHTFRHDGNLRSWLLSILHNVFVDGRRSRRSEQARIDAAGQVAATFSEPPQEHVVRLSQIREAFLDLPEEQRAALHLVAIEGLSYQDAADALRIPIGTLMSRIGRARASLRQLEAATPPGSRSYLKLVGGRDE